MKKIMNKPEAYHSSAMDEIFKSITPSEQKRTDQKMLLAAKIDDALRAKAWKKKDLAKALNKRASEITKWLSGTHNFTTDTLWDIEKVLCVELVNIVPQLKSSVVSWQAFISSPAEPNKMSELSKYSYQILYSTLSESHSVYFKTHKEVVQPSKVFLS
ncbi:MAG: helix-turn-helix transcriptional regulator [Bacteroidetes bacterium]|nr:helix-turn-helix transcriptional regulator [Bacteroidota bacterium]